MNLIELTARKILAVWCFNNTDVGDAPTDHIETVLLSVVDVCKIVFAYFRFRKLIKFEIVGTITK